MTKTNLKLAPGDYIRKQTLTNAERFFTLELKEHESLIANASERLVELETNLYRQVCAEISRHADRITQVALGIARIDVYAALAETAVRFDYVRPELNESGELVIVDGRHPMIKQGLPEVEAESEAEPENGIKRRFAPNDPRLYSGGGKGNLPASEDVRNGAQIMLLTAPNMAGKSVYL